MPGIVGWDIGGVNVKATWLDPATGQTASVALPFEIWRARNRLPDVLRSALEQVAPGPPDALAITMTAELSDVFMNKREGVSFVLDCVEQAFPGCPALALDLNGRFVPLAATRARPLDFAAANWLATAGWLAQHYTDCVLLDVGSTTTDIIPIMHGVVAAAGRTDLDRLLAGELVYTGALRTQVAAIVQTVPVAGRMCPVSSEYFAISADVHLVLGYLSQHAYSCPTPDGRPVSIDSARARLARLVCADREQLGDAAIEAIARYVYTEQVGQIARALAQVCEALDQCQNLPAVILGLGTFLGRDAAARCGLQCYDLAERWGEASSLVAPSWAAAQLLAAQIAREHVQ